MQGGLREGRSGFAGRVVADVNRRKPTVGVALGAGAARGLAHIGVLKVLEREGIPIDFIAGTSAGAVIGGIYAATRNLRLMERLAQHIRWDYLVDLAIPKMGFVAGEKAVRFLDILTHGKEFKDLLIPFAAVACDIERGEEVVLSSGKVAPAIRASMSIPGIVAPIRIGGRLLVDGAVLNRVPSNVVRNRGMDLVIAVSIGGKMPCDRVRNIFEVITRSIELMELEILESRMVDADVVIEPDVMEIGAMRLDLAAELISRGERAAEGALPKIKRLLEEVS